MHYTWKTLMTRNHFKLLTFSTSQINRLTTISPMPIYKHIRWNQNWLPLVAAHRLQYCTRCKILFSYGRHHWIIESIPPRCVQIDTWKLMFMGEGFFLPLRTVFPRRLILNLSGSFIQKWWFVFVFFYNFVSIFFLSHRTTSCYPKRHEKCIRLSNV